MLLQLTLMTLLAAAQEASTNQQVAPIGEKASQAGKLDGEQLICRRKMTPDPRMEGRMRSMKICKTKENWKAFARRTR